MTMQVQLQNYKTKIVELEKKIEDLVALHKYEMYEKEMVIQNEKHKNKVLEKQIETDKKISRVRKTISKITI